MERIGRKAPVSEYSKTDAGADIGRVLLLGAAPAYVATGGWGLLKSAEFAKEAAVNMLAHDCTDYPDGPHLRVCDNRYAPHTITGIHGEDSHGYGVTLALVGSVILIMTTGYILTNYCIDSGGRAGRARWGSKEMYDAAGHALLLLEGATGGVLLGFGTCAIKSLAFVQDAAVNMLAHNCTKYSDESPHLRLCDDRYAPNSIVGYSGDNSVSLGTSLLVMGAGVITLSMCYIAYRGLGSGEKKVVHINDGHRSNESNSLTRTSDKHVRLAQFSSESKDK